MSSVEVLAVNTIILPTVGVHRRLKLQLSKSGYVIPMLTLNFNSAVVLLQAVFARLQMSIPSKPGGWGGRG